MNIITVPFSPFNVCKEYFSSSTVLIKVKSGAFVPFLNSLDSALAII